MMCWSTNHLGCCQLAQKVKCCHIIESICRDKKPTQVNIFHSSLPRRFYLYLLLICIIFLYNQSFLMQIAKSVDKNILSKRVHLKSYLQYIIGMIHEYILAIICWLHSILDKTASEINSSISLLKIFGCFSMKNLLENQCAFI